MNNPLKTVKYRGYDIEIYQDEFCENPRLECDNFGTMICFHRNYNLGDKHDYAADDILKLERLSNIIWLPLYLYDHSNITISTQPFSCPWDSGRVGIIFVDYEKISKEFDDIPFPKSFKKAKEILESEVRTYDQYLRGEIYGYAIKSKDEEIDLCWGFYGDPEDCCIPEAKSYVDWHEKDRLKKHLKKLKNQIQSKTPLQYRFQFA